ncbi:hypothetical protein Q9L42_005830 [Methylomarinum sp. Ch1-1]|uniref:Uncharacterized protein n=1 Tax=Methylomarinum roseum TaxID=3067653 RepID=A0AAU7NXD0_9GAMM|nr:hypothetical protein [Methylomarinum sp. Ch1-1]MDP4522268.1 hypothetical protein [Methylomarinum sp. Ch1-1]
MNNFKMGLEDSLVYMDNTKKGILKKVGAALVSLPLMLGNVSVHKQENNEMTGQKGPLTEYVVKAGFNEADAKEIKNIPDVVRGNRFLFDIWTEYEANFNFESRPNAIRKFDNVFYSKNNEIREKNFPGYIVAAKFKDRPSPYALKRENPLLGDLVHGYYMFLDGSYSHAQPLLANAMFGYAQKLGY